MFEVTSTAMVQTLPANTPPLASSMDEPPSATVRMPPQVDDSLSGVPSTRLAGSVSRNARLVAVVAFALLSIVKVSVEVPPSSIVSGEKDFENRGVPAAGAVLTVSFAEAEPLLPRFDVRLPVVLV